VLQHTLRDAQLAGHDTAAVIDRITAAPMDGAQSIASVLHGRLQRLHLQAHGSAVTWAQRTPENAPALAHELAAALDNRRRELGERALANHEPWLTRHLGPPPGPDASPVLREDYARRAGTAAAYREARGITDLEQAVSFGPHPGPELEALRKDTFRALEITDEHAEIRAMTRGELEAQALYGNRAQATAPRDTSSQLRMTAQAQADAWQQAADSEAEHDQIRAENSRSLATALAAETSRLEASNVRYEEWSASTASTRKTAGKAKAELRRRGQQPSAEGAPGPQSMATWWRLTRTLWTVRSNASTRPPFPKASRGRRNASRKPGMRDRLPSHPGLIRSWSRPGQEQPGPRQTSSQLYPSWKPRLSRPPHLGLLTTARPPGWMSYRLVRTRPYAGSTRNGQNSTPAASTRRGSSGRTRPSRRLVGRRERPMTWK